MEYYVKVKKNSVAPPVLSMAQCKKQVSQYTRYSVTYIKIKQNENYIHICISAVKRV